MKQTMNRKKDKHTNIQFSLSFWSFVIAFTIFAFSVELGEYFEFKLWLVFVCGSSTVMGFIKYGIIDVVIVGQKLPKLRNGKIGN